ncbi:MAG: class I SAM-dependent methyltransferase [Phycisphaerales bacterium]|nr:class I SAM-dependent methyltransferase [Phycisphaerae bacterium]NNF43698.1 class I SAM-dependent methyltransferase [Phycisphaerales bacterium]NNM25464.1 class I SAM-dependent methyltransferase [Phycisphaerales bacterium]
MLTAKTSDRHELYEQSVQEPEAECDLIEQIWKEQRDRPCRLIREDFCGTAVVAMEWIKRRRAHTAIGVDLDGEVLQWARKRIPQRLTKEQRERLTLLQENVLEVDTPQVDSVLAMNFSYYLFRTRAELVRYFEIARDAMVDDGIFLLDAYGGSESFEEMEEERELDGFTYVWDQHHYSPITGDAVNYIHFDFPDGSRLERAFEYHWRLWTLPEIREMLEEAGFRNVWVYWEGTDEDGDGDGDWAVETVGEACAGWVAYLAASKI